MSPRCLRALLTWCLKKMRHLSCYFRHGSETLTVSCKKFTFGAPAFSSRLSIPAGHLPHEAVLSRNVERLLTIRAARFGSPLTHHWGVVVIGGNLAAGRLVGVTGGAALAQVEGLLGLQQVWTPVECKAGWHQKKKKKVHVCTLWGWAFFFSDSLWRFSSKKVIHHVWICFQQTHQNLILQFRRHLKNIKVVGKKTQKIRSYTFTATPFF